MNSFQNVTVLGDGAWGTALAMVLAGNGKNTILWGPFPENLREIREKRENKFLKGVAVPFSPYNRTTRHFARINNKPAL